MSEAKANPIELSVNLEREGYYLRALQTLEEAIPKSNFRLSTEIRRACLLERIGRHDESRVILERVRRARGLTESQRSECEHALGRIEWDNGDRRAALAHFTSAVTLAEHIPDLRERCWPLMSLLLATSHSPASAPSDQMLSLLRLDVLKAGDARVLAELHETVGRMEGKRGLARSAKSHFRRASQLLETAPNVYLQALIQLEIGVIAGLELNVKESISHTTTSLALAQKSGSLRLQRASLANLGFCHYLTGEFELAIDLLQRAESMLPSFGDVRDGMLETLARIYLAQGSLEECDAVLSEIEDRAANPDDRLLWGQRHASLTRTRLLSRQGRYREALSQADRTLDVAKRTQDQLLYRMGIVEKSHILQQLNRLPESLELLQSVAEADSNETPELHAQYEALIACALLTEGRLQAAEIHRKRSERIFLSAGFQPGLIELSRRWSDGLARHPYAAGASQTSKSLDAFSPGNALQAVASLLAHSRRPMVFANGLIDLFEETSAVAYASATVDIDGIRQVVACGGLDPRNPKSLSKRLTVGAAESLIDISVEPKSDAESVATVNAIMTLVSAISELERARLEREQQIRLWPIDDVDVMQEHAVVTGKMQEMMAKARRVATTDINVLLTGESGTGKEIFARAIHAFSARTTRPFVPFNCAALPRDMVESQLFGHRRGAFTGADRDNLGVIRAARGGTLFLDEIGELSIELQPKLLRFLESGEICPLGETTPFNVDVRIVAATNAKLDQSVKEGRFREDLFYRLHGVRIEIPPLRERRDELPALVQHFLGRAAVEFKKGNVRIAEETVERLLLAPWPGNVRQLQNELRRMVALAEPESVLTPAMLSPEVAGTIHDAPVARDGAPAAPLHAKLNPTLERIERQMVKAALDRHRGKMDDAAKALGISRKGLYLKRQRLGL